MNRSTFRPSSTAWWLMAIVAIAAVLRFRGLTFGLPHTQARPDETVIIDSARALLSGRLPRFYDYPWLYIWMVTISYVGYFVWGWLLGTFHSMSEMVASWPLHWTPFFMISRTLSAGFGIASVAVVYRLGKQARDSATGLGNALFLAVCFMHVQNSHFGTTDVAMVFFILWGVSLLLDAHDTQIGWRYAAAGAVCGLAAATKYNAILLLVPLAVSVVLTAIDRRDRNWRSVVLDGNLLRFLAMFVVTFSIGVPFLVVDRQRFFTDIVELKNALAVGDPRLGLTNGWLHHLEYSLRYGMRVPLLVAGLAGTALFFVRNPKRALLVFSFPIAYYAVAGSIDLLFFRYALPVAPWLCLAAAYLVVSLTDDLIRVVPTQPVLRWAAPIAALALAYPSAKASWEFDRIMREVDNRVVVSRWFAEHVPPGSTILQSGGKYGHAQFERGLHYKQWVWNGERGAFMLGGKLAAGHPDWILIQDSPLPSTTQQQVKDLLADGYTVEQDFHALTIDDQLVYDRLDAFYVPFDGFANVERPGPNFTLYRRVAGDDTDHATP